MMSTSNGEGLDIPTALPGLEEEDEREQLLQASETSSEIIDSDEDLDEEAETYEPSKKSRRSRALKAVAGMLIFLLFLFATVSWFFGLGVFSAAKTQSINRTPKGETQAPISEDEKLKMALSMVAAREPSSNAEVDRPASETPAAGVPIVSQSGDTGTDVFTTPAGSNLSALDSISKADLETKELSKSESASNNTAIRTPQQGDAEIQAGSAKNRTVPKSDEFSAGRSNFFGKEHKNTPVEPIRQEVGYRAETSPNVESDTILIPFGTLLPVRLTSAVYTFRNSGGFVRMELTRAIEGEGYSYPAGTAIIGTLRGAESTRVFVTVTGLIDPASRQLVKLGGELLGRDGGSGLPGRKKKVSGVWSRLLRGLRETGSSVVSSIGGWRSGGTVIIGDSMRRAGSDISGSLNDTRSSSSDGFVQIDAGSMGYVQVTGLPEVSSNIRSARRDSTESGLSDEDLADLFNGQSADKLRAALPRMTPEFRRLAEKTLENIEGR